MFLVSFLPILRVSLSMFGNNNEQPPVSKEPRKKKEWTAEERNEALALANKLADRSLKDREFSAQHGGAERTILSDLYRKLESDKEEDKENFQDLMGRAPRPDEIGLPQPEFYSAENFNAYYENERKALVGFYIKEAQKYEQRAKELEENATLLENLKASLAEVVHERKKKESEINALERQNLDYSKAYHEAFFFKDIYSSQEKDLNAKIAQIEHNPEKDPAIAKKVAANYRAEIQKLLNTLNPGQLN